LKVGADGAGGRGDGAAGFLVRDRLFVALTRPQMFGGVTYSFFVANLVLSAELYLILRSVWVLGVALVVHAAGWALCRHEPRFFDLWLVKLRHARRVPNRGYWRCNSYRP